MRLSKQQHYISVHFDAPSGRHRIRIFPDIQSIFSRWDPSTRISPIWPLTVSPETSSALEPGNVDFVCFLGPLDPADLSEHLDQSSLQHLSGRSWLSIGSHNLILFVNGNELVSDIIALAVAKKAYCECWHVEEVSDGGDLIVEEIEHHPPEDGETDPPSDAGMVAELEEWLSSDLRAAGDGARDSVIELCALLSVVNARSKHNFKFFSDDARNVSKLALDIMRGSALFGDNPAENIKALKKRDIILALNAGISRFVSQALSGTSPITQTESNYWPHSFLGTGIANTALRNIAGFVTQSIRSTEFNGRFHNNLDLPVAGGLISESPYPFEVSGHVACGHGGLDSAPADGTVQPSVDSEMPIPITYFSGRDGFRNGIFTTSAPLLSISGCNSPQWNLGTITHELSHRIISGKLSEFNRKAIEAVSEEKFGSFKAFLRSKPLTIGDLALRYLCFTYVKQQASVVGRNFIEITGRQKHATVLARAIADYGDEMEERLVHMFDFFHFYEADPEKYISAVWLSWAVQPSIAIKLRAYVERTLLSLATNYIAEESWRELARADFIRILNEKAVEQKLEFRDDILNLLSGDEWVKLQKFMQVNKQLLALFSVCFRSDALRTVLSSEALSDKGGRGRRGRTSYSAAPLVFGQQSALRPAFTNPLKFIRTYSRDQKPDSAASAWLLHMLTFNFKHGAGLAVPSNCKGGRV